MKKLFILPLVAVGALTACGGGVDAQQFLKSVTEKWVNLSRTAYNTLQLSGKITTASAEIKSTDNSLLDVTWEGKTPIPTPKTIDAFAIACLPCLAFIDLTVELATTFASPVGEGGKCTYSLYGIDASGKEEGVEKKMSFKWNDELLLVKCNMSSGDTVYDVTATWKTAN